jgi:Flp pilus assembly protein TadD
MYNLAMEKMHHCHFGAALRDLQQALSLAPDQPLYLSFYGLCLAQLRQFETAILSCKRALGQAPDDTLVQVNLGKVYRLCGDNDAAYRMFLLAWQGNKHHPAPAAELARMGVRRPPVLRFLPRSHWCNRCLGRARARLERALLPRRSYA